jgi:diketogulonate reductase-like aldo/keto reductase
MSSTAPIDPSLVPHRRLAGGAKMPAIGLGTFGSDHVDHQVVAEAVATAVALGYRHIDCASVYGNEAEVGAALAAAPVPRQKLWISSKLWNDDHQRVAGACEQTLRDLKLDYLDNYLVHWPFPNFHPPHCDVDERNPDAVPFRTEAYLDTWGQMETLVERGLVRHIGTSNMTVAKLDAVLPHVSIVPSVNQMELHPHFQQPALFAYLVERDIAPIGFCPIGSPDRPERDRTPEDSSPTTDPVLVELADQLGIHPASLCVKWAVDNGHTPIPFSTNPRNIRANLQAAVGDPLTEEQRERLRQVDQDCRLIKGQVFLWRDNQPWQDLWDEDGTIAG